MCQSASVLQQIIDSVDQGIIYINNNRQIQQVNEKAKEILGIHSKTSHFHPEGKIMPGDIVIIADNAIGYDDGNLSPEDLSLLSINDKHIHVNDMFVGVGVYKNKGISPVYKNLPHSHIADNLTLKTSFFNFQIESSILSNQKKLITTVNGVSFELSFMNSAAHIVILDSTSGTVKFFQSKGYTIRNEDLRYILLGKEYLAKGYNVENVNIIGKNYIDIIGKGALGKLIESALCGEISSVAASQTFYINKIIVLCSISPILINHCTVGIVLNIIDTSELSRLMKLRNDTLEEIEKITTVYNPRHDIFPAHFLENIVGTSEAIQHIKFLAYKSTMIDSNIIITGESGTGKSQLAYEMHSFCRKGLPFVEVNCNAIAPSLFESELFGYVGGAFTGALSKGKIGYFEKAANGTIFLDEIGDLSLDMQVKLLNVLQSKTFYRVGSSTPVRTDAHVIAATNKDLWQAVKDGTFRQDLYYRLNVFPIRIPPLRERKTDIYLLVSKLTRKLCERYGIKVKQYSGGALNKLSNYEWPGNIRELENVIERAIALSDGEIIYPEYIDIHSREDNYTLKDALEEAEKKILAEALVCCGGDKAAAISRLDISRSSFYDKLKKYQLD